MLAEAPQTLMINFLAAVQEIQNLFPIIQKPEKCHLSAVHMTVTNNGIK